MAVECSVSPSCPEDTEVDNSPSGDPSDDLEVKTADAPKRYFPFAPGICRPQYDGVAISTDDLDVQVRLICLRGVGLLFLKKAFNDTVIASSSNVLGT